MRRIALIPLALTFLAMALAWSVSLALPREGLAQQPSRVVSSSASIDFPNSITFKLTAQADADIKEVTLVYEVDQKSCAATTAQQQAQFIPGRSVEATWFWDMRKGNIPPGADLKYHWLIKDAVGNSLETQPTALRFDDPRYQWRNLSSGPVTVYWYSGDNSFARALLDAALSAMDRLKASTGAQLERPVRIYIYGSQADLLGATIFPQEWTGGYVVPGYPVVVIGISPSNLDWGKTAEAHELTHLVVDQVTFNCYAGLPTWLNEGLATYNQGPLQPDQDAAMKQAVSRNTLFSVTSLSGSFPAATQDALLAYAESRSIVSFLIDRYGSDKMLALLSAFKAGSNANDALMKVYSFDHDGLDAMWRQSLGLAPRPAQPTPTPTPPAGAVPTLPPYGFSTPTPFPTRTSTPTPSTPTLVPTHTFVPTLTATPTLAPPTPTPVPQGGGCSRPAQAAIEATMDGRLGLWLIAALLPGPILAPAIVRGLGRRRPLLPKKKEK